MSVLSQNDLNYFLQEFTGIPNAFELFEKIGIYGGKDLLFSNLKNKIEICLDYLHTDFETLIKALKEREKEAPEKSFEAINHEIYQDKMHPIKMVIYYAIFEPFLLRSAVKQEMLYLAFKLQDIKKIYIGGVGSGEALDAISDVSIAKLEDLQIKGVDISQSAIDFCKYKAGSYKFKLDLEVADLDCYEINEEYDLAELSEVLEHVRDPQAVLAKVGEKSKLIFVTIPIMLDSADHLHLFKIKDIVKMIKAANLDLIYYTIRNSFYVKQFFFFGILKRLKG